MNLIFSIPYAAGVGMQDNSSSQSSRVMALFSTLFVQSAQCYLPPRIVNFR